MSSPESAPNQTPPPPSARKKQTRWAKVWWWVRLGLVIAMLVGLFIIAGPTRIWRALVGAEYLWVLGAIPVAMAAPLLDSAKLYFLIKPHGFRGGWLSVLRTNLVVNCVSVFLPGTVGGGAVAWYRLSRPDGLRAQTFAALSLNMVIKVVALCGAGAAALALDARASGRYKALMVPLLIGAAVPLAVLFLLLWTGLASRVKGFHVRVLSRFLPGRLHDVLRKILESLETYRATRRYVILALMLGLARRLIETFIRMLCLYAVGVPIGYIRILWVMCASEAASMMPFTMSGLGLPQVTVVALLSACGVSGDRSVASEIIAWIALLPVYLSGAGILLYENLGPQEEDDGL